MRYVSPWSKKGPIQRQIIAQSVDSYFSLCLGIGIVAIALPFLLVAVGGLHENYSISFFYHRGGWSRDIFVGSLWATGVFLILYQGYTFWEWMFLNLAGVCAIGVAMVPMGTVQCPCEVAAGAQAISTVVAACDQFRFSWHLAFAVAFFACLFVVSVFLGKVGLERIIHPPLRERLRWAYNVIGFGMIVIPGGIVLAHALFTLPCKSHWVFWLEAVAIWLFGAYWFVKLYELRLLVGRPRRD
ncbi:MAG: hypothetical protein ACKVOP_14010 [Sphingomonadaceae bacterium]